MASSCDHTMATCDCRKQPEKNNCLLPEDIVYQKRKEEYAKKLENRTAMEQFEDHCACIDYWCDVTARLAKMRLVGKILWSVHDKKLADVCVKGILSLPTGSLIMYPEMNSLLDVEQLKNEFTN